MLGGLVGIGAFCILALLVHPRDEPLDRSCQCTRRRIHGEYDDERRQQQALAAAAVTAAAGGNLSQLQAAAALRQRPAGARLCDAVLFPASKIVRFGTQ